MMTKALVIVLLVSLCGALEFAYVDPNIKSSFTWKANPIEGDLPKNFHWGKINGVNYLSQLKNQHIPQYCGSCWAQATTSALSDRIAIMRGNRFPEINISPQVLLSCATGMQGCHGGDSLQAYQWMHDNDITDETCAPYQALSWQEGLQCNATALCAECFPDKPCLQPKTFNKYRVGEYAKLPPFDQEAMKNEIFARGPITCSVYSEPIEDFTGTGVFMDNSTEDHNHVISIVGWGETSDGIPFWEMRNSWGEYWADNGFAKIYRGNNTIQIESNCVYGVPIDTWSNQPKPETKPIATEKNIKKIRSETPVADLHMTAHAMYKYWQKEMRRPGCAMNHEKILIPVITQPLPQDYIESNSLPEHHFWGDIDNVNYLSWTMNQHLPQYCGSCWAMAGSASISDRINILRNNQFPRVALSVQVLLNCMAEGTCHGGWGAGPFEFAHRHGLPENGCQIYLAKDPQISKVCTPEEQCLNCKPDPSGRNCWAVGNYKKWYVSDHGSLRGPNNMKKEIFARGPISCGMFVTEKFETTYTTGIYRERTLSPIPNHYVSVVGWGKDKTSGEEYWIVRNTWGTYFGESGYFRISMHSDNLGIGEYQCFWGVPSESKNRAFDMIVE